MTTTCSGNCSSGFNQGCLLHNTEGGLGVPNPRDKGYHGTVIMICHLSAAKTCN